MARRQNNETHTDPERKGLGTPLLSLDEVVEWTGIKKSTLYSLNAGGRGPKCGKIGRQLRFRSSDVDAWFSSLTEAGS